MIPVARPSQRVAAGLAALSLAGGTAAAGSLEPTAEVAVHGRLARGQDLSAIESVGRYWIVASDEGADVQWLGPALEGGGREVARPALRLDRESGEVDIEALASDGDRLWILGSHARKRKLVRAGASWAENRRRIATVEPESRRDRLVAQPLDPDGAPTGRPTTITLRGQIDGDAILRPFAAIPDKENGLALEALAAWRGRLWIGCRSPILREGYAPVIVLDPGSPSRHELRLVQLEGRGLRGMDAVSDGLLLLAGYERGDEPFALWWWDGGDQVPGSGSPAGTTRLLGSLPTGPGAPEGIAVLEESPDSWRVVVIRDGVEGGRPQTFEVPRPAGPAER